MSSSILTGKAAALADIREAAEQLVILADTLGVVVTIAQKPLQPLAMGNYESVVDVRAK